MSEVWGSVSGPLPIPFAPHTPPVRFRVIAAAVAGNALEFYDFLAYAYFSVFIGRAFFPATTAYASLMLAVGVFGVGFVLRPLGGLVIGAYGDRAGRRPALILSLSLISIGTLGIAVTPTYATIGIAAPIIVTLCRMAQGFALGGEVGPATAFLIEAAPAGRRAAWSAWQPASQHLAGLVATATGLALSLWLAPATLAAWGWRLPFLLALPLVALVAYLRRALPETGAASIGAPKQSTHRRTLLLAAPLIASGAVFNYFLVYLPTFAIAALHLTPSAGLAAGMAGAAGALCGALLCGRLADRLGRRAMLIWPRVALIAMIWPAFAWIAAHPGGPQLAAVAAAVATVGSLANTALFAFIPELLPRAVRCGGFGAVYATTVAIFGGTAQLVFTWLIRETGSPAAPAVYISVAALAGLLAIRALPETLGRALD